MMLHVDGSDHQWFQDERRHDLPRFWYRFLGGSQLRELEQAVKRATSEDELRSEIARSTRQKLSNPW
jgi:hypothetical protein